METRLGHAKRGRITGLTSGPLPPEKLRDMGRAGHKPKTVESGAMPKSFQRWLKLATLQQIKWPNRRGYAHRKRCIRGSFALPL